MILQALRNAKLSATDIEVVEAHGTGTTLGDPIEAQALIATYGKDRVAEHPLWLGSIKSNLGHTQAAAGVAGIIKMVLAMEHSVLPKTLHAEAASPHVDWSSGTVRLLSDARPWARNGHLRRAGVSSFGVSGTNAHVILEEAPPVDPADTAATGSEVGAVSSAALCDEALPFVLSGKSESALAAQARRLAAHVEARPELALADVAHSLATTRTHFEQRAVVIARERAALLASLQALGAGEPAQATAVGRANGERVRWCLSFPGRGRNGRRWRRGCTRRSPEFRAKHSRRVIALLPNAGARVARCVRLCLPKSTARRPRCSIRQSLRNRRCLRWRWRCTRLMGSWGDGRTAVIGSFDRRDQRRRTWRGRCRWGMRARWWPRAGG